MDLGFVILCPDRSTAGLKNSLGSIKLRSYQRDSICVVDKSSTTKDVKDLKDLCPTYKGKDTITSLINTGMKKIKNEWVCMIFGGSRIPHNIEKKLSLFCKKDSDVIYPLVENKYNFVDGSFNGVTINKNFFEKVGDFPDQKMKKDGLNDFELAKLLWADAAMEHGVVFKGILGMRVI